jgi:putative phage-type endonuclease
VITPEQRELRRKYVGSSDAPALFGLDPYRTAADVWLSKTGRVEDGETTEAQDRGNLLEPAVLDWAEREIGEWFARGSFLASGHLCANFDGIHDGPGRTVSPFLVEAKTTTKADEWGEPGTDEVPERVIVQVHHQFVVAGHDFRVAYVPVLMPLFGRFDFRMYEVRRDDALAEAVAARGREFMERYVLKDTPPPDVLPNLDVLRRVRREPGKVVQVADELVDAWQAERAARLEAEKREAEAQRALLAALGEAEAGDFGRGRVTYLETKRKAYAVEETTYRTLRVKKGRAS